LRLRKGRHIKCRPTGFIGRMRYLIMLPDGVYWANALFNNVVAQFIGPGLINQATTKIYGG